jgi:hypothetical protein
MFNRIEWCREGALLRVYPRPGERVPMIGNASEAMMYLRLTDEPIESEIVEHHEWAGLGGGPAGPAYYSACVHHKSRGDGYTGIPVTHSEAGFYYDVDLGH